MLDADSTHARTANQHPMVYLVDDHEVELELMRRWCSQGGLDTQTFDQPEVFLETVQASVIGCIVADLRMPKLTGLDLQRRLREMNVDLPLILVTGYGDAENCRAAFHQGVFDFIEKGFDSEVFLDTINRAIEQCRQKRLTAEIHESASQSLATISPRERDVMRLLGSGATLKIVAQELGISVQTVSKHRSSIFNKLNITNEVDLYKTLRDADFESGSFDVNRTRQPDD